MCPSCELRYFDDNRKKAHSPVVGGQQWRCDIHRIQSLTRVRRARKEVAARRKKVAIFQQEKQQQEAVLKLQRLARVRSAKIEAGERRKRKEAAVRVGKYIFFGDCFRSCFARTTNSLVCGGSIFVCVRRTGSQGTSAHSKMLASNVSLRSMLC